MQLIIRLKRHTQKFSDRLRPTVEIFLRIFYTAVNTMKLIYIFQIYRSILAMKKVISSIHILYTGLHKSFSIHYDLLGEMLLSAF